jgi:regulatory protein
MPTVTDIKKQKRSETRYSIYLDGKYVLSLSDLDLSNSGLRVGHEVSEERVQELQSQSQGSKAYAQALRYIGIRPRSEREVRDYLARKETAPADADTAVERLRGLALIDDLEFAAAWIRHRQSVNPRSRRRLEQELMQKGVERGTIEEALRELDGDTELDTLVALIERKQRLPQYSEREKLMAYFARQGYGYDVIKRALERVQK